MALYYVGDNNPDGIVVGVSTSTKLGFFGTSSPVTRPSGAAQAAVTDSSGGTAAPTNGIATITGTYNQTIIANAIATLAAQGNALRNALVSLNMIAGA